MLTDVTLAYIDPASGTLLLQALIAAAIGGVAFFRRSIWRVLTVFSSRREEDQPPTDEVADPPA
jgi:hypothetical protein